MKNPQQSLKDWGFKNQADQFDYELTYGQCQTFLQSNVNYDLHCAEQQTQPHFPQTTYDLNLLVFAFSIDDVQLQARCFALAKPSASFLSPSSNDCHQYDQLVATPLDLEEKLLPLNDVHILHCFVQEKLLNIPWCVPKALAKKSFQTLHDVSNSCRVYLTNLIVHYQNCLLSSVHQFQLFQPKVRSFCSPVGGL